MSTQIKIYWDTQDRNNEGWAYTYTDGNFRNDSGELTNPVLPANATRTQLEEAIEALAWEIGFKINGCDAMYMPEDGGCIEIDIDTDMYTITTDSESQVIEAQSFDEAAAKFDNKCDTANELLEKYHEMDGAWIWIENDNTGKRIGGYDEKELAEYLSR